MTDLGALLAVGLAGFLVGAAYQQRENLRSLAEMASARAIVIEGNGYTLEPLFEEDEPEPPRPGAELHAIEGGKSGDAA